MVRRYSILPTLLLLFDLFDGSFKGVIHAFHIPSPDNDDDQRVASDNDDDDDDQRVVSDDDDDDDDADDEGANISGR